MNMNIVHGIAFINIATMALMSHIPRMWIWVLFMPIVSMGILYFWGI